jgi:hypothetical protein
MGLDFSCFGDTTNCDISLSTIKVPELESDTKIPTVELPKPKSSDLVIKDTFLPLELAKLPPPSSHKSYSRRETGKNSHNSRAKREEP